MATPLKHYTLTMACLTTFAMTAIKPENHGIPEGTDEQEFLTLPHHRLCNSMPALVTLLALGVALNIYHNPNGLMSMALDEWSAQLGAFLASNNITLPNISNKVAQLTTFFSNNTSTAYNACQNALEAWCNNNATQLTDPKTLMLNFANLVEQSKLLNSSLTHHCASVPEINISAFISDNCTTLYKECTLFLSYITSIQNPA